MQIWVVSEAAFIALVFQASNGVQGQRDSPPRSRANSTAPLLSAEMVCDRRMDGGLVQAALLSQHSTAGPTAPDVSWTAGSLCTATLHIAGAPHMHKWCLAMAGCHRLSAWWLSQAQLAVTGWLSLAAPNHSLRSAWAPCTAWGARRGHSAAANSKTHNRDAATLSPLREGPRMSAARPRTRALGRAGQGRTGQGRAGWRSPCPHAWHSAGQGQAGWHSPRPHAWRTAGPGLAGALHALMRLRRAQPSNHFRASPSLALAGLTRHTSRTGSPPG